MPASPTPRRKPTAKGRQAAALQPRPEARRPLGRRRRRGRPRLPRRPARRGRGAVRPRARSAPRDVRALSALNDSKQHTEEAREELYPIVLRTGGAVARRLALRRAASTRAACTGRTSHALRDALRGSGRPRRRCSASSTASGFRDFEREQRAVVDGDATSAAIAAASIVAKVSRDRFMHRADDRHPGWEFAAARRLLDARPPGRDPAAGRLAAAPALLRVGRRTGSCRPDGPQNAPSRCSRSTRAPVLLKITPDRVEAERRGRGAVGHLVEVGGGHPPDLRALAEVQALPRAARRPADAS